MEKIWNYREEKKKKENGIPRRKTGKEMKKKKDVNLTQSLGEGVATGLSDLAETVDVTPILFVECVLVCAGTGDGCNTGGNYHSLDRSMRRSNGLQYTSRSIYSGLHEVLFRVKAGLKDGSDVHYVLTVFDSFVPVAITILEKVSFHKLEAVCCAEFLRRFCEMGVLFFLFKRTDSSSNSVSSFKQLCHHIPCDKPRSTCDEYPHGF